MNFNIDWVQIKTKLREAVLVLPQFFRNPVQGMRTLPSWEWPEILILQAAFAAGCSFLANLLQRDILGIFTGIIIAPLTLALLSAIMTGIFYYVFKFYFEREVPYRQIYIHVLFASIPIVIVSIAAFLVPPITISGKNLRPITPTSSLLPSPTKVKAITSTFLGGIQNSSMSWSLKKAAVKYFDGTANIRETPLSRSLTPFPNGSKACSTAPSRIVRRERGRKDLLCSHFTPQDRTRESNNRTKIRVKSSVICLEPRTKTAFCL